MRTILEHVNGQRMRVVRVPFTSKWLSRFNRRFAVEKRFNGTFTSRFGYGYCIAVQPFDEMEYTFCDIHE